LTNPNYLIKAVYRLNVYYKILAFNIYLKPRNLQGSYLKLLALFLLGMVTHFVLSKPLILQPQISPNGKLITADINQQSNLSNSKTLLDGWATPSSVAGSPDSRWLAYSLADLNFNYDIYIHAADNSESPVNVSMHPKGDVNPVWSSDGSKLGFSSMGNNGDYDIWFAWLNKRDWQRSKEQWKRNEHDNDDKGDKGEDKKEQVTVKIDFVDIYKRL
jgi:hypothetical protein